LKIKEASDFNPQIFAVLAQESFDNGLVDVTISALEMLLSSERQDKKDAGRIVRNIIQLLSKDPSKVTFDTLNQQLKHSQHLVRMLQQDGPNRVFSDSDATDELEWAYRVSWNAGKIAFDLHNLDLSFQFFKLAGELCQFRTSPSKEITVDHIQCVVHQVAIMMMNYKENPSMTSLKHSFDEIVSGKNFIKGCGLSIKDTGIVQSLTFLFAAELKVRDQLGQTDQELLAVVEEILGFGEIAPLTVYGMLTFCEEGARHWKLYQDALKLCLQQALTRGKPGEWISLYVSLTQVSPTREASFELYDSLLNHLKSYSSSIHDNNSTWITAESLVQLRYAISEAWNNGIYYLRMMIPQKAELWASLSQRFCNLLNGIIIPGDDSLDVLKTTIQRSYPKLLEKCQEVKG